MITRDLAIENRIIRRRARLGYPGALVIRRAKLGEMDSASLTSSTRHAFMRACLNTLVR
jgi:hypothetical protein